MPRQPAKTCPEGQRYCPDCAAEGLEGCRPLDEFGPPVKAARYKGGVRWPAFCKRHKHLRETKRRAAAPEGSQTRDSMRAASRRHYQRYKDDDDWKARRASILKAYRQRNKAQIAASYKAWAAANRERRRAIWRAWKARHSAENSDTE